MSQTEMAQHLGVDQTTISGDIKALKRMSQRFIFDLAKGDLGYYFKQSIDGIDEAKSEAWRIFEGQKSNDFYNGTRLKLLALKIVISANEAKFKLLSQGESVLAFRALENRLSKIETAATTLANSS